MISPDSPERREELARKWLDGTITPDEEKEFARWYNQGQDEPVQVPESHAADEASHRDRIFAEIGRRTQQHAETISPGIRKRIWWRAIAAAAVLLVVSAGVYLFTAQSPEIQDIALYEPTPGQDKATLMLEDGTVLSLDSMGNGVIRTEKGLRIRQEGGLIVYESLKDAPSGLVDYNTITIPRGGQYRLQLPDGSMVWLNSESSLRYPTRFTQSERHVKLTGEAFFDIAPRVAPAGGHPGKVPFIVNVNNRQLVRVLGTQFNINSYDDERTVKTTLLEGSVEVAGLSEERTPDAKIIRTVRLKPNQQSRLSANGVLTVTDHADTEEAVAWKNGQILFRDTDVRDIMRQVARWYDVDIVYEGEIPARLFTGGFSRNTNLTSLLRVLETSGIHFKVEGRRITVTP